MIRSYHAYCYGLDIYINGVEACQSLEPGYSKVQPCGRDQVTLPFFPILNQLSKYRGGIHFRWLL
jgi:hypothetical protein